MKKTLVLLSLAALLVISACGSSKSAEPNETNKGAQSGGQNSHAGMDHSSSSGAPEGMREASSPTFPVGSKAVIADSHMSGMEDAETTIAGAYDTTVYTVSYTPVTGGERVTDHKWVVHEEIKGAGNEPFKPGDEVVLDADHMPGMEGATAKIDSAKQTTVYMVDFTSTTTGEEVKNHKWVTEEELALP
ncbi:YdhK family protein [Paenibacillus sp. MAHUQ-46]|uniref:YdhK family protein n=2 Tax=Paenibacillus TaxID=44249 RepID=A0A934MPZ0_9BACL|nr:YdhK family protein [Paenibacillus roseus]MBJ6362591.1 YdhK family protein [Paenibacillus roseus]